MNLFFYNLFKSIVLFKNQLKESSWKLGICINGFEDLQANVIHWIDNGVYEGKKWFADPFILDYDEETIDLLVEEFDYKVHRGRIAHIIIDRGSWTIVACRIILDLSTHLSFPAVYRIDGKVYVCPENFESGAHNLYFYNQKEDKLEFVKTLYNDKLTDTTLTEIDGRWYMLTTSIPHPNGHTLEIMCSDQFDGDYRKVQEVVFTERNARNAGQLFCYNGCLLRPAQFSDNVYGRAIIFQKVTVDAEGKLSFENIYRYDSTHNKYNVGTHTYNEYKGMAVIDIKGYRYNTIGRLWDNIINLAVKLGIKKPYVFQ